MVKVIDVKFKPAGRTYYFDPGDKDYKKDDYVIVETMHGQSFGFISAEAHETSDESIQGELKPVIRKASESDVAAHNANLDMAKAAFAICNERIVEHKLEMKLIDVEYTFDRSKILFYFIADNRVDFRELVRDLASEFHTRIEMRQIGPREEARLISGLGMCGREFCCALCMSDFPKVNIKTARDQGLALNPAKISGCCGKLLCCLCYEQEAYLDAATRVPAVGKTVSTPEGTGSVVSNSYIRETVQVKLPFGDDFNIKSFNACDVKLVSKAEAENDGRQHNKDNSGDKVNNGDTSVPVSDGENNKSFSDIDLADGADEDIDLEKIGLN